MVVLEHYQGKTNVEMETSEELSRKLKAVMLLVNGFRDCSVRSVVTEGTEGLRKMWRKLQSRYASISETAHITMPGTLANKILEPGGNIINFVSGIDVI